MKITDYLKDNLIFLDGAMGTLLQKEGLNPGELPELWNLTHPDVITSIHKSYLDAGANVLLANTFGANPSKFAPAELDNIIKSAIENARRAILQCSLNHEKWVALDIGPSGRMLAPYGDFDFEDAVSFFAEIVKLGSKHGADLVFIETMNDSYETKAALLAVKENCDLPVFVSNAYSENGKLMTGASPAAMVALLEGMGADAIGANCSFGPDKLKSVIEEYLNFASVPVILKPNAGLPKEENGKTVYDVSPDDFAQSVKELIKKGVRVAGGCCGTTPEFTRALSAATKEISPVAISKKEISIISSYTKAVVFDEKPVLIGERINPTGKKRFKEALRASDIGYVLKEGISQQELGVDVLDVNVGLPEIDEEKMLKTVVCELQAVVDLPLQIDTTNFSAMETALRRYNGKAMINSVNGKKESMDAVFPLAAKYGGLIVALTLDDNGIPETAEGRFEIAKNILNEAEKYGISKKDIIFDPLALTISADKNAAFETIRAISMIKNKLLAKTTLGVSNVSFGLPQRGIINGNFFMLSLANGLSAAIINPYSTDILKAYYSYCALMGLDDNCEKFIDFASGIAETTQTPEKTTASRDSGNYSSNLVGAITKGLKNDAAIETEALLKSTPPLKIVEEEIIPALDIVGMGFENKTVYLPQLLMSAEAAKYAFEQIKKVMPEQKSTKCCVVIATVKGDIHDIGKNIVKLLLENYGFMVYDLGKDVDPEIVCDCVIKHHAPIAGLSALMTTTVPQMEKTIALLKERAPWCKTVVGGAVLTQEYADAICADKYCKDAMETVRYADEINNSL